MNRKGFMMAELVVVSAIIVISLTALYASYNKIITSYRQIVNYYDVGLKYKLNYYYQTLFNNELLDTAIVEVDTEKYLDLSNKITLEENENIYLLKELASLEVLRDTDINETFKDYLTYLDGSIKVSIMYYVVGEQCNIDNKKCKYAYLEVPYEETR